MEKTEEIKRYLNFQKKLRALRLGEDLGCKYACEVFKISKTTYYNWKRKFDKYGKGKIIIPISTRFEKVLKRNGGLIPDAGKITVTNFNKTIKSSRNC